MAERDLPSVQRRASLRYRSCLGCLYLSVSLREGHHVMTQARSDSSFQTVAAILNRPEFNVPRHLINHPYGFFFKMSRYELQSRESGTR